MSVARLCEEMTAAEESHWIAEYRTHPWGDYSNEAHLAQVASLLYNVNAKKDKRLKLKDFLLFRESEPEEDIEAKVKSSFFPFMKRKHG